MKRRILKLILLITIVGACKKDERLTEDQAVSKLVLSMDKSSIYADGHDAVNFNVQALNAAGVAVSSASVTLYVDGESIAGRRFMSSQAGIYRVVARSEQIESNALELTAIDIANKVASIVLTADRNSVIAGHYTSANFDVKLFDLEGKEVGDDIPYQLYAGDDRLDTVVFSTDRTGEYVLTARVLDVKSNEVSIRSMAPEEIIAKVQIESDTRLTIADGVSIANLQVKIFDKGMNPIDAGYDLFINGKAGVLDSGRFRTRESGDYHLRAKIGGLTSEELLISARPVKNYPIITIPVVFHIYEDLVKKAWREEAWFGEQYDLTSRFVEKTLGILNDDYSQRMTGNPNAVDTRIRFRLATRGPDGHPLAEPGINRLDGVPFDNGGGKNSGEDIAGDWAIGNQESYGMAKAVNWDVSQYINIHVVGGTTYALAWATYPYVTDASAVPGLLTDGSNRDGYNHILMQYNEMHIASFYNESNWPRTLTHEMGHYLGLLHLVTGNDCQTDDYCPDTFSYHYGAGDSEQKEIPCEGNMGLAILDNFMDAGEYRQSMNFTYDQRERMQYVLAHSNSLKELKYSKK